MPIVNSDLPQGVTVPPSQEDATVVNPYDIKDPAALAQAKKRLERNWKTANHRRYFFELNWLRNVLYALDIQWIRVDWTGREVRNLSLAPNFPRAITNKYAKVNSDLLNAIIQGEVPLNAVPNRDNAEDESTAEIYESLRDVIDAETGAPEKKRDLGFWLTYTGNAFIEEYYDYSTEYGVQTVPEYTCSNPACQAGSDGGPYTTMDATKLCPCGGPPAPPQLPPQPDATGQMIQPPEPPPTPPYNQSGTQDLPIGRLCFDTLSPFEVYWDNTIRLSTGKQRWYFRPHHYDISTAREHWKDFADKIRAGMPEPMRPSRSYLTAIAYAGSFLSGTTGSGEAAAREEMKNKVIAWKYKELPTVEYPQGLEAVQIGDNIVELGPLSTKWGAGRLKDTPFFPLVHFYGEVSGGAWGRPRANSTWSIQARRNIIESNLQLTIQRTGAPKLLEPLGAGLTIVTGEAGQRLQYKPINFGGAATAKPEYLEAALGNIQPIALTLKMLDDAMEELTGTQFVQGGDAPSGVTAASALAFLGEKANRAISPLKEHWAEAWGRAYQYAIEIIRVHWTDERILAVLGRNRQWQFEKFKAADLTGAIDIRVDYEALFPKSQATKRADIMELSQMGVIAGGADPEQNYAILEAFGQTDLKESQDEAIGQARREWDRFLSSNGQIAPQLKPVVQNSPLHLMQHKKDAQTQEYEQLPPEIQQLWDAHVIATQEDVVAQSMPMTPDAGAPPSGSPPAKQPGSQHGSQNGSAKGNLASSAPIRKGQAAADNGTQVPNEARPIGEVQPH